MSRRAVHLLALCLLFAQPFAAGETAALSRETPSRPKLYTLDLGGRELRFLTEARELGAQQVFLCELAESRAQSEQVKALAGVLKQTQLEENQKLVRLAASKGMVFDQQPAAGLVAVYPVSNQQVRASGEQLCSRSSAS